LTVRLHERDIKDLEGAKIFDLYHWEHVLQEDGCSGKVVVCRLKNCSQEDESKELVLKMTSKQAFMSRNSEDQYRKVQERLLNFPSHPGVLAPCDVMEDERFYYNVMDKADGGTLFQYLLAEFTDGVIPAAVVKRFVRELLEALSHVHRHGMLHRDVKPDNVVVHKGRATLIDFDHAEPDWHPLKPAVPTSKFVGTMRYSAPEVFQGYFSEQSDLYSAGVLFYLLMTGRTPRADESFRGPAEGGPFWRDAIYQDLMQESRDVGVDWQCDPWPTSPACRELCESLLCFSPNGRPQSAAEALTHRWFTDESDV
jgi:serine/threonine protein kinase